MFGQYQGYVMKALILLKSITEFNDKSSIGLNVRKMLLFFVLGEDWGTKIFHFLQPFYFLKPNNTDHRDTNFQQALTAGFL